MGRGVSLYHNSDKMSQKSKRVTDSTKKHILLPPKFLKKRKFQNIPTECRSINLIFKWL